jgi:hypothetical protein
MNSFENSNSHGGKRWLWKPGQSGNPGGRPAGRTSWPFSKYFLDDLKVAWVKHGARIVEHTATNNPELFFGICSRLVPRDVTLTVEQAMPRGLDADDLAILRAIRAAIPDANSRSPDEVMTFVLEAIRQTDAKLIEGESE